MASTRTPLLAKSDGRPWRRSAVASGLGVTVVACLGLVSNGYATLPLLSFYAGEAPKGEVDPGFEAGMLTAGETVVRPLVAVETWTAGPQGSAAAVLEEHYLAKRDAGPDLGTGHIFLKQAYTYWRYGLWGPRAMRGATRGATVTSYRYDSRDALMSALAEGSVARGSLVWVTVTSEALDTELPDLEALEALGVPPTSVQRGVVGDAGGDDGSAAALDTMCVYQYTPDVLLRSRLLRALFAYDKPLVLVLAGDSACRLETLPETHHRVVLANDGAPTTQKGADLWFPEGLEGLEAAADYTFWTPAAQERAEALTDAPQAALEARPFLFDTGVSVNGRMPSRQALVRYLKAGGAEALGALADAAGLAVRFNSTVVDAPYVDADGHTRYSPAFTREHFTGSLPLPGGDGGDGAAVFALAPAGDTWTSGRVLEAMLTGAIPVVDATYRSDGGVSAKGCGDAAAFWQFGQGTRMRGAPFVFVDAWDDLPAALAAFGAGDAAQLRTRLADVQGYRDDLETYLRTSLVGLAEAQAAAPASTTCETVPLSAADRRAQVADEADYYASDWYGAFVDSQALYTSGCSQDMHTVFDSHNKPKVANQKYAHCYDAACAPPNAAAFECAAAAP